MYPISFFTFKKELVGGPEGWETERHVETPEKALPVRPETSLTTPLGKRVSKPPEKLIMETEVETPQRQSKRSVRPPDKFEADSSPAPPPEKKMKLEPATPPVTADQTKPTSVSPSKKTDFVPIAPRKSPIPIAPAPTPAGTLKLKTFSKMNVKNQLSGEGAKNKTAAVEESEVGGATVDPKTTPQVSSSAHTGMTITKVKKSSAAPKAAQAPNSETINL